ncbi:hypothetical protein ACSVMW_004547 [Vibrio parahaemolyticus]
MDCICSEVEHSDFDEVVDNELKIPILVKNIANDSVCVSIEMNIEENLKEITLDKAEILQDLKGKMGIYQLWVEQDYCGDHFEHRMLCVYVGKGYVHHRITYDHLPNKWNTDETLYITFYECSNRMAVYLEQLFLETYSFHFNKQENTGTKILHTLWDESRFLLGTETQVQSEKLAKKNPEFFNP